MVSIKSGSNSIEQNVFKECQGSVVLRHGDNNFVSGNYFLGNNKPGSGGVRVINKGQKVISNIFYKCRGVDFRSPLAIMNGIPNSPANRYVQVTDAEITDNMFYECAPVTFCEGSDTERTLPPDKVLFSRNTFYNTMDAIVYKIYDDMKGFRFGSNKVSSSIKQVLMPGFEKTNLTKQRLITKIDGNTLKHPQVDLIPLTEKEAYLSSGASWFPKKESAKQVSPITISCSNAEDVYRQLEKKEPVNIKLTGKQYLLNKPFEITKNVQFTGDQKSLITFTTGSIQSVFVIGGNGTLILNNLNINGESTKATHFISNDSNGSSNHYNLTILNCSLRGFNRINGCENIFFAYKNMVADSILIYNNSFINNNSNGILMAEEKDNKGYYSAEKIIISQNNLISQFGTLLNIYRGGNDESTMGPNLLFTKNKIKYCNNEDGLIKLFGVQQSSFFNNSFTGSNQNKAVLIYTDNVRATHLKKNNTLINSGTITENKFVTNL